MKVKLHVLLFSLLIFFILTNCDSKNKADINLVPKPVDLQLKKGNFLIEGDIKFYSSQYNSEVKKLITYFSEYLKKDFNIQIKYIDSAINLNHKKSIVLNIDKSIPLLGKEGYELEVNNNSINITATNTQGAFYAFQTIFQLIDSKKNNKYFIPNILIKDKPRFEWRGMHLDVARHIFPIEFIKKYIDYLAMQKMNVFHWHLTDDQGWRIEIKKYPFLTEKSAWREDLGTKDWDYFMGPAIEGKPKYGGFYTQKEIKEVVEYAKERYVTIVPEIGMPGHTRAALDAYPELYCSGAPFKRNHNLAWEFTDPYCVGNNKTYEFIENVLSEVIELFPSEYIHIGGDEAKKTTWKKCSKCNKLMLNEGIDNAEKLQSFFIKKIEKFLLSKNKKLIGWDEIFEGGLAPEATVMAWRDSKWGVKAAKMGHNVVMAPEEFVYFNFAQDSTGSEPNNFHKALYLDKVYNFEPMPDAIPKEKRHHILGGQGNLWSEYIVTPKDAEHMLFPRLFAMSEVLWSPKENKDYNDFIKRLGSRLNFLEKKNIAYYIPVPEGLVKDVLFKNDTIVKLKNPLQKLGAVIKYTTDGSEPVEESSVYKNEILINSTLVLKARLFLPNGNYSNTVTSFYSLVN